MIYQVTAHIQLNGYDIDNLVIENSFKLIVSFLLSILVHIYISLSILTLFYFIGNFIISLIISMAAL